MEKESDVCHGKAGDGGNFLITEVVLKFQAGSPRADSA
jgi:hypothetical protein